LLYSFGWENEHFEVRKGLLDKVSEDELTALLVLEVEIHLLGDCTLFRWLCTLTGDGHVGGHHRHLLVFFVL